MHGGNTFEGCYTIFFDEESKDSLSHDKHHIVRIMFGDLLLPKSTAVVEFTNFCLICHWRKLQNAAILLPDDNRVCWFVQVFDVVLNGQITVVDGLDIFAKVGRGVAHDEIISFSIHSGQLQYGTETVPFTGRLFIEFVKVTSNLISFFSS